jgi:hypothetical protein
VVHLAALAGLAALAAAFVPQALGHRARAAAEDELQLAPIAHASHVQVPYKLTASVTEREQGESFVGVRVNVYVLSGPNAGRSLTDVTDENGRAHFTYTSGAAGTDQLVAGYFDTDDDLTVCSNVAAQTWVAIGTPLPKPPPGPTEAPPPSTTPPPPTSGPVAGKQSGCRSQALVSVPGSPGFAPAQPNQSLPVGTVVDASGESALTIEKPTGQQATFYGVPDGVPSRFKIASAAASGSGLIVLKLVGGNFATCKSGRTLAAKTKPKPVRRLWGSGKGSYRTTGKYASATVRGTEWLVSDYCTGTLVTVRTGTVLVNDLVKKRPVIVRAGHSYFATK